METSEEIEEEEVIEEESSIYKYVKLLIAIFMILIFLDSDVFIDKVLSRISGATEHKATTTKGAFIRAFIAIFFITIFMITINLGFP